MKHCVLAFDVYGTLVDTAGITAQLREHVGDRAAEFARLWREKQLEYTFRRGLMGRYEIFPECTRRALEYCCAVLEAPLSKHTRNALLDAYRVLPAYPDALPALSALQKAGHRMFAFSNGVHEDIASLLRHAGVLDYMIDIVSVDEIGTFKPSPAVYRHFLQRASADGADAWLISGNPFDVIGAVAAGMRAAWVRRASTAVYDPWEFEPTITIASLGELGGQLANVK